MKHSAVWVSWCAAGLLLACAAAAPACGNSYGASPDVSDASDASDATDATAPDGADPCVHVVPPPPPAVDDAPNTKLPEVYLALRSVHLVPPAGEPLPGLDLDGVCTCEKGAATAYNGGVSCGSSGPPLCDLDGGVDNQAGRALQDFAQVVNLDKAADVNGQIDNGVRTAIVVLTNYNGRANDKAVGFGIFTSGGMRTPSPCAGSGASSSAGFFTPGWCGDDTWTATANTLTAPIGPPFVPTSVGAGYVSNYTFVAHLNGVAAIPFAGYHLAIGAPIMSGRLVPLDDQLQPIDTRTNPAPSAIKHWRIVDAVLAGRIPAPELLAALGTAAAPGSDAGGGSGLPLCKSNVFAVVKTNLCSQMDMSSSAALDFTQGVACDALSTAVAITADEVKVNGIVDPADAGNECYPSADGKGPVNGPPGVTYTCP
jgi:hypothetical protein